MNNRQLCEELRKLVQDERRVTNEILRLINIAMERRTYLELGYASMFDWLVKDFGYSNAAAFRRIEAARLVRAVPEAILKLESGQISLSSMSRANSAIRTQERISGEKVSLKMKQEIVKRIENKSTQEVERELFKLLPETQAHMQAERRVALNENTTRHSMNFSAEMSADLQKAKELLSHKFPHATDAEVIGYALKVLLQKIDPTTSAAEAKRVTKSPVKRLRLKEAGCTFKDSVSGRICGSRYQVQVDHIHPKGLGGRDSPENLRPLCRQHNLLMAERVYGREYMSKFRKQ